MIRCIVKLSRLKKNLSVLAQPVALMVKANSYGHGLKIAQYADDYVCAYGVATEDEGLKLRLLTDKPILVTAPDYRKAGLCIKYYLTPMISSSLQLASLSSAATDSVKVHLKVDTGMGRFGTKNPTETARLCSQIAKLTKLRLTGIGTHFSSRSAAYQASALFDKHIQAAESVAGRLLRHAAASGTCDIAPYDMRRIGFSAYSNVLSVYSTIAAVKRLRKGESSGYNNAYTALTSTEIGVIYGGYADGIRRACIGYSVKINGKYHRIVAVCMDVFMVELSCKCEEGDTVCICSSLKDIEKMAAVCRTIPYEIYTGFVGRCGFEYKE